MRAHKTINVSYLRPVVGRAGEPDEPPPLYLEGDEEYYQPEFIKSHRRTKVKGKWTYHSANSWQTVQDLRLCPDMVREYWEAIGEPPPAGALPR